MSIMTVVEHIKLHKTLKGLVSNKGQTFFFPLKKSITNSMVKGKKKSDLEF